MGAELIPARGWLSLSEAATYVGVSRDLLREAVAAGELRAYSKPRTCGRARSAHPQARVRIGRDDIDEWVRTWPEWSPGAPDGGET